MAVIDELLARSHALGADKRVTNYGGGNTSAKDEVVDPLTGEMIDVLHVKGSGGDLGTLSADGLATLRLDALRGLKARYRGVEHEDEMVELLDHCCVGVGAAPSIDTAMHGLLPPRHVDHLHPDAVIAFAAAADGEALTKECFGDDVAWVPWRRPGFELALEIEAVHASQAGLRGVVLGGHGLTAWGETSDGAQGASLQIIREAEAFIAKRGKKEPFGPVRRGYKALPSRARRDLAARLAPLVRSLATVDAPMIGHFDDSDVVLDFMAREAAPRLVALGTSCPDHFIRTKVRPLLLDVPPAAEVDELRERLIALHAEYRDEYAAYYDRYATPESPAMRGSDPAIFLIPASVCSASAPTPRQHASPASST